METNTTRSFSNNKEAMNSNKSEDTLNDFEALKRVLRSSPIAHIHPNQALQYYAKWWELEYQGGQPSIKKVFQSLGRSDENAELFFEKAKRAADRQGIKWIGSQKFRTLLVNGGIPVNFVLNSANYSSYERFLKKLIQLDIEEVEQITEDIKSILPKSCRDEFIYESALKLLDAIRYGNTELTNSIERKNKSFADSLRNCFRENNKRRATFIRQAWLLDIRKAKLFLELNFSTINQDSFYELFAIEGTQQTNVYEIMMDGKKIAKCLITGGKARISQYETKFLIYPIEKPEIVLKSRETKIDISHLLSLPPAFDKPSLWLKENGTTFKYIAGNCTKDSIAYALLPPSYSAHEAEMESVTFLDQSFALAEFENQITCFSNDESDPIVLVTGKDSYLVRLKEDLHPKIIKSAQPLVINKPRIQILDAEGDYVPGLKLEYKASHTLSPWGKQYSSSNKGLIQYRVKNAEDELIQGGSFFNMDSLNLDYTDIQSVSGKIKYNIEAYDLVIRDDGNVEVENLDDGMKISLKDVRKFPKKIEAYLAAKGSEKRIKIELLPPFKGIFMVNKNGELLPDKSSLLFTKDNGVRIYCLEEGCSIRLRNTKKDDILMEQKLGYGKTDLRDFQDLIERMLHFWDPNRSENAVSMQILNAKNRVKNTIFIKPYNGLIKYKNKNPESNLFGTIALNKDLPVKMYALPVDVLDTENILKIHMKSVEHIHKLPEYALLLSKKFIFFSDVRNRDNCVRPEFENFGSLDAVPEIFYERIAYYNKLLQEASKDEMIWKQLYRYLTFCDENHILFSALDLIKSATCSSEVMAKLFVLLFSKSIEGDIIKSKALNIIGRLEMQLGACFHWIPAASWHKAMFWICGENNAVLNMILEPFSAFFQEYLNQFEAHEYLLGIKKYIFQGACPAIEYNRKHEIYAVREKLSATIHEKLPKIAPFIPQEYRHLMPTHKYPSALKSLLQAPVAVALSITGKSEYLWNINDEVEEIRRNIQFIQFLQPNWYAKTLLYSLNKLNA